MSDKESAGPEDKIDKIVIAQADDETSWEKPVRVRQTNLKQRSVRGSKQKFVEALSKVPDVSAGGQDRLD